MTKKDVRYPAEFVTYSRTRAFGMLATAFLVVASCATVGPDYVPPEPGAPPGWNVSLEVGVTAEPVQSEVLARWWTVFDDPLLSDLITRAVGGNPDLKQAKSRIREARARRDMAKAGLFPTLDTSGTYTRSHGNSETRDHYRAGFDAGWELDLFGGTRRGVEAADATLQASQEDYYGVLVSLAAEVGLTYLETRTFQRRLEVAHSNLRTQEETFDLVRFRYQADLSDELTLQQARYNLESTRAQIPNLRAGLTEARNRLAVLTGKAPGGVEAIMSDPRPIPVPPPTVAVGIPAEALKRRPDIRKAERQLAAQTARIGVATADLFPRLRLSGTIGLEARHAADFFRSASRFWNLGPGVSWNVFDAGAIRGNIEVQSALQEQSLIAYEKAVLDALMETENALAVYAGELLRRERLQEAVEAAQKAELQARVKFRAGLVDFTTVLDAQRSLFSFQEQQAVNDGAVTSGLIRLYKALGGGWDPVTPQPHAAIHEKEERQ